MRGCVFIVFPLKVKFRTSGNGLDIVLYRSLTMDKRYIYFGVFVCILLVSMALTTVIILFTFICNNNFISGSKLIIDHDGGADDAMAIFMALIHEKYFEGPHVVAITTTFGNVDEPQAFINTQKILDIAKRKDVPIYRGSKAAFIEGIESDFYYGYDGLGDCEAEYERIKPQPDHASQALVDFSKKYEGNLTIVATGAGTNIALAIKMDPQFISRLSMLYVGAGHVQSPQHEDAEFNAAMDPEAYYIVTKEANPNHVTVVPFSQVYSSMNLTKEWRESTLGAIPTKMIKAQNCFERISLANSTDWTQLDPAVMAFALNRSLVEELRYSKNSIVLCGDKRGINTNQFTSVTKANVGLIYSGRREYYQNILMNTFQAELTV